MSNPIASSIAGELPTTPNPETGEGKRVNRVSGQRLVIWIALLVLAIPLAWGALQREVARWHAASAYAASINGEKLAAIASIDRALDWAPDEIAHRTARCHYKLQAGDAKSAINDAEHALRLARAATADRIENRSVTQLIYCLNTRAYVLALAETNVESALENINESLSMAGQAQNESLLDTRAYVRYLLGDYDGGLEDAELAVALMEQSHHARRADLRRQAQVAIDKRPFEVHDRQIDEQAAVTYQHRGLLYEKTGQVELAKKDLERASKMGFDPANGVW